MPRPNPTRTRTRRPNGRYRDAQDHLSAADARLARVIAAVGPCTLRTSRDLFAALVNTVISQQISTRAADTIAARIEAATNAAGLTPESVLALTPEELRACGLSRPKQRAIRAIAERVACGELDLRRLRRATDGGVAAMLLPVPGLGPWSVHMIQIFALSRPNVLPVGDLGLRLAIRDQYGLAEVPGPGEVEAIARPWHPYCTVATWYLWRSRGFVPKSGLDGGPG
jgi:3-methyladenine DNA glycosylase/8-oxoguanine DNA glycosylase